MPDMTGAPHNPDMSFNPAWRLRNALRELYPQGMLRYDTSGRGLIVCDAPRKPGYAAFEAALSRLSLHTQCHKQLLFVDLPDDAYANLPTQYPLPSGSWHDDWFSEQALLSSILADTPESTPPAPDISLLRQAIIATALGESSVRQYIPVLRSAHAQSLREHAPYRHASSAALCAQWLWQIHRIGLPTQVRIFSEISN